MNKYLYSQQDLIKKLESIKAPQPAMPICKQRLKGILMEQVRLSRRSERLSAGEALYTMLFAARRNMRYALPALAVFFLLAALQLRLPAPQPFAYIVLEVNPTIELAIDTNNNVTDFKTMDPPAQEILDSLNLRNKNVQYAISGIVNKFYERNVLVPNRRMLFVAHPVEPAKHERLVVFLDTVRGTVAQQLAGLGIDMAIQHYVIDAQTHEAVSAATLRPSQYARLLDADLSPYLLAELTKPIKETNLDTGVFTEQFAAIAEMVAELSESGLPANEAVNIGRELLAVGLSADAMDEMISRIMSVLDEEPTPANAIAKMRRIIGYGWEQDEDEVDDEIDRIEEHKDAMEYPDGSEKPDVNGENSDNRSNAENGKDSRNDENSGYPGNGKDSRNDENGGYRGNGEDSRNDENRGNRGNGENGDTYEEPSSDNA